MAEQLKAILEKTLSPNQEDQNLAKSVLQTAYDTNYAELVKLLSDFLHSTEVAAAVRQAGGLQLKNALVAKDEAAREEKIQKWISTPLEVRSYVKAKVLSTLGTETAKPSQAAQCVCGIALIEVGRGLWEEAIPQLMNNVTNPQSSEALKEGSLEALGYVCQDIDPAVLASKSNSILTAIVNGMKKEEPSERVRLAAVTALYNSLEFTHNNFANDHERHLIMQVICEATQSPELRVRVVALQCLVKIMSLYYAYMEHYMGPALFAITLEAMKSPIDEVALQGIEFWSNVAEEELELALEAEEATSEGRPPESVSKFYAKGALKHLIPLLTHTLAKQDEHDDEDEWNPAKAAGVSLMLMAQCVGDDVVQEVLPFITTNIRSGDWKLRDAAVMSFGSVLEGPDPEKLKPLVQQALPFIIELVRDPQTTVRDSAAWTIGRVCETCPNVVVLPDALTPLLPALSAAISQEPRVATNACWAISSLAVAAYESAKETGPNDAEGTPQTYILSQVFDPIVSELLKTTDRPDAHISNLRNSAYEALMELIKNSPKDCYETVQKTTLIILKKIEQLLAMEAQVTSPSDKGSFRDIQSLLCATLQSVLKKMEQQDAETISEPVMAALTRILAEGSKAIMNGNAHNGETGEDENVSTVGVVEDALMAVSTLIEMMGANFERYLPGFKPYLIAGLGNHAEYQVCQAAVGVVADLCRALEAKVAPYMDEIMALLIAILEDQEMNKMVKPTVLSTFGDVALALGVGFVRYAPPVLALLAHASQVTCTDKENYDEVEFYDSIRESVLEGYTGIIQGLRSGTPGRAEELVVLQPAVPGMLALVERVAGERENPDAVLANAAGLIGDLATAFGRDIGPSLETPAVGALLQRCRKAKGAKPKSLATWAAKQLKALKAAA